MKKLLPVLLAAVLLMSCTGSAAEASQPWQDAYTGILSEYTAKWGTTRNDAAVEFSYLLCDMDMDGVPELIVKTGTCEADYMVSVYTFRNGAAVKAGETGAGHSSFYGDSEGGGLIVHCGHMGFAYAMRYWLSEDGLSCEELFEDDLNSRLVEDPDAWYYPVADYVPGAYPLTLCETDKLLPLTHYEEICAYLAGNYPKADGIEFPNQDRDFYAKVILENKPVTAVPVDRFAGSPGAVRFQDLLKQNVAAPWMYGNLKIDSMQTADLNGDGRLECILELSEESGSSPMRFFLSEQDGTVYVYLQNYAYDGVSVDENGNLLVTSSYDSALSLYRLVFDRDASMLLALRR